MKTSIMIANRLYRYCNLGLVSIFLLGASVIEARGQGLPDSDVLAEQAPDSFLVEFDTSKGAFTAKVHRSWSPLAADRFYHLVNVNFFDEVSIFRVVPGFVAQFGIHNEKAVNDAWKELGIADEPTRHSNRRGTISFARAGPESRITQIFINLKDNAALDQMPVRGVNGYPPFAEVVAGMEVIDAFNGEYANEPSMRQDMIHAQGRAYLDEAFPGLDYIKTVRIVEAY